MEKIKIYAKSIIIPIVLGGIVGLITSKAMNYSMLNKPSLSPPGLIFPIVWTILYILMGISYGILDSREYIDFDIKSIYFAQLIVNLLWPILFFVFKWRLFAFIWILLLISLVINMIIKFYQKDRVSGLLQIPYLIWLVFAGYLNLFIYFLN